MLASFLHAVRLIDSRAEQLENAQSPSSSHLLFSSKITVFREIQLENAELPISFTSAGIT